MTQILQVGGYSICIHLFWSIDSIISPIFQMISLSSLMIIRNLAQSWQLIDQSIEPGSKKVVFIGKPSADMPSPEKMLCWTSNFYRTWSRCCGGSRGGGGGKCIHHRRKFGMTFIVIWNAERRFLHVNHFLLRLMRKNFIIPLFTKPSGSARRMPWMIELIRRTAPPLHHPPSPRISGSARLVVTLTFNHLISRYTVSQKNVVSNFLR